MTTAAEGAMIAVGIGVFIVVGVGAYDKYALPAEPLAMSAAQAASLSEPAFAAQIAARCAGFSRQAAAMIETDFKKYPPLYPAFPLEFRGARNIGVAPNGKCTVSNLGTHYVTAIRDYGAAREGGRTDVVISFGEDAKNVQLFTVATVNASDSNGDP